MTTEVEIKHCTPGHKAIVVQQVDYATGASQRSQVVHPGESVKLHVWTDVYLSISEIDGVQDVVLYTKPDCQHCVKAKKILRDHAITYTEKLIGKDVSRDDVLAKFPSMTMVPILVADGKLIGGSEVIEEWILRGRKT